MKLIIVWVVKWIWILWKISPRIKITHKLNRIYTYKKLANMKFGKRPTRNELIRRKFPNIRMATHD